MIPIMINLNHKFYNRDALVVAHDLIGKIICHYHEGQWLQAQIIETEAYKLEDKASHASLGFTEKRKALFMPAGTIYMYYARGGDSLNISTEGDGNAVLIKSAIPYITDQTPSAMLETMQRLNPRPNGAFREPKKLCSGQTLLCRALNLKVPEWDQQTFDPKRFYIGDCGYLPQKIIRTTRLGIPTGRDEHLPYRFVEVEHAASATHNPLRKHNKNKINILSTGEYS